LSAAASPWTDRERRAWGPRPRLDGAEWAAANRVLSFRESPQHPGKWQHLASWMVGLLQLLTDPTVDEIAILKCAQTGVSELVRNAVGQWADLDPGPVQWVMTIRPAAEKGMRKLQWMFDSSPALRPLVSERSHDTTLLAMALTNGMEVAIGWSGSLQSLSSDPQRRVILDEAAKYKAGRLDYARERLKTFGRRALLVVLSSPEHEADEICVLHDQIPCKLAYRVPCPDCGTLQALEWPNARWPGGDPSSAPEDPDDRVRLGDVVKREQSAWVACVECEGRINPQRAMGDPRCAWLDEQGEPRAERDRRVAVHVSELYHWETTISDLVAKYLYAVDPKSVREFWKGSLGRPYKEARAALPAGLFRRRATYAAGVVPAWALLVVSTADTQSLGWWYMVRAWGKGGRSRLLAWGWADSEEQLVAATLDARFPIEGGGRLEAGPQLLAVDTGGGMITPDGSRTHDVYRLATRDPRVVCFKGQPNRSPLDAPMRETTTRYSPPGRGGSVEVELRLVNSEHYKDRLAAMIRSDEPVLWEENETADAAYQRQMASEHKVMEVSAKGTKWLWKKRAQKHPNHLWDCAVYQIPAADLARLDQREEPTWTRRRARRQYAKGEGDGWTIGRG